MSYILEALKKSEQQREIGRVPGITSVHENAAKSVAGKWLWLIIAILLLNAGLLALLLWPHSESELESDQVTMSAPVREPVQLRRDRPVVVPVVRQPAALGSPAPHVPPTAHIAPVPESPVPEPVKTATADIPVSQEPEMPATVLLAEPPVEQTAKPAVESDIPALPVWPQIPSHLFQQLSGSLRLDVHVFSDQPQKSFVLINMRKYREGEKLQEGLQLDEITAEGVILSFNGQRFRLQAQ